MARSKEKQPKSVRITTKAGSNFKGLLVDTPDNGDTLTLMDCVLEARGSITNFDYILFHRQEICNIVDLDQNEPTAHAKINPKPQPKLKQKTKAENRSPTESEVAETKPNKAAETWIKVIQHKGENKPPHIKPAKLDPKPNEERNKNSQHRVSSESFEFEKAGNSFESNMNTFFDSDQVHRQFDQSTHSTTNFETFGRYKHIVTPNRGNNMRNKRSAQKPKL